jgi:hypothetical protein
MIRITCTNCKAQLSIDEAFAGGVCRCQFCGTIQTVPKHLKSGAAAEGMHAKAAVGAQSQSTLYRNKTKSDMGLSSGLDAIAEVVASSGLSGSGLTSGNPRRSKLTAVGESEAPASKNQMLPILLVAGIVIILLLGVVIGLLMRGSGGNGTPTQTNDQTPTSPDTTSQNTASNTPEVLPLPVTPKVTGPAFFGVKVSDASVIFVIDRGSGTHDSFEYMKIACVNTLDSLRPEQKYQVIFWKLDKDKDPVMLPKSLTAASNKDELKKTETAMDDVNSLGQSNIKPALEKAFSAKPSVVIIATGKAVDDGFAKTVMDARKNSGVKVTCLSLNEPASSKAMQEVANKTGGTFKLVSLGELQSVSR